MHTHRHLRSTCAVALVLGVACDPEPSPSGDDAHARSGAIVPIDDFRSGADTLVVTTHDQMLQQTQTGASIVGGNRCILFEVGDNPYERPATVEVLEDRGQLAVDTGVGVSQAMLLLYGYDETCNGVGLDLDLGGVDGFRIDLATTDGVGALDLGTAGGIVVWSGGGNGSVPLSITAGSTSVTVPFADFSGTIDWGDVQQIAVEIQTGGAVPGHDYVLTSIAGVAIDAP